MKCFSIKRRYVYRSVFVKIHLLLAFISVCEKNVVRQQLLKVPDIHKGSND